VAATVRIRATSGLCEDVMMRATLASAAVCMLLVAMMSTTAFAASKSTRISISYVSPKEPELQPIYDDLKERRLLERLQEFLSPFRLPRTLTITLRACDGEADAFYGDDVITICYEYVRALWKNAPEETTPAGIKPIDTVVGPFLDTCLHEFAHALFDMLKLPILGREEDAADQVAAYVYLQLGFVESYRLITGTAYAYLAEAQNAGRPPSETELAGAHSTPTQRAYNALCIAYGADAKLFGSFLSKGYLPKKRARSCAQEYEQVQDAYEALVGPHIDQDLAKQTFKRTWLRKSKMWRPR
jgi:hypothetical protein